MAPRTLLDLPDELLLQLPMYMYNIEDFKNASSACRRLRAVFADTLPKTILRLASSSAPTFFSPHPDFLVLAVARQIATWALASDAEREARAERLVEAFREGTKGILALSLQDDVEGVGLTMDDIRRMYEARFNIINPLNKRIDAMIGNDWYDQPDFWYGGVEDAFTLYADVPSAIFQLLTYGEMFGSTMASYLQPCDKRKPGLGIETRIEFVKYCIPDSICGGNSNRHDGFQVLPVGPYAEGGKADGNQTALAHLVGGAMFDGILWRRAWRRVLIAAGTEENEDGTWPQSWIERIQKIRFRQQKKVDENGQAEQADEEEDDDEVGADNVVDEPMTEDDESDGGGPNAENTADPEDDSSEEDHDWLDQNWVYSSVSDTEAPNEDGPTTDWRFSLFWNALTEAGGLQTMEMVAQFKGREENRDATMKPEWKAHILQLRDQVLALKDDDEPGFKRFGKRRKLRIPEAPNLAAELYWCCAGVWMGL